MNRRDQFRLLRMVGLVVVVMVAMKLAADPSIWRRLLFLDQPAQAEADRGVSDGPASGTDGQAGSARRRGAEADDVEVLRDDEFRLIPDGSVGASQVTGSGRSAFPAKPVNRISEPPVIDPEVFREVEDDFVGLRAKEADAFYHVLDKVADVDPQAMQRAAVDAGYAVLMDDPHRFRGKPVTVEGEIKGLTKTAVPPNEQGLETVYEAWLFNRDSWPNPYCIRCLEVPGGIPMGSRISGTVRVRATGYFFKNFGYASEGGFSKAPMILARRLERLPTQPAARVEESGLIPWLAGFAGLMALVLAVSVWRFRAGDRKFEETHLKRLTAAPREAIDALSDVEQVDPADMFRRMSEAETPRE